MIPRAFSAVIAGALLAGSASAVRASITFNFTNMGGATQQMMDGVAQAGALWAARFDDPIAVNIHINAASLPAGVLGHTDSFYDPYPYADVRSAMIGDRRSADDVASTNKLQPGPGFSMLINDTANNPNGVVSATPYFDTGLGGPGQAGPENNSTIRLTTANAKALGLSPGHSVLLDGTITFSTQNIFDFDRSNGINASQVDFVGVAAHEIGHVLGFDSGVDVLAGNATPPGMNDNQLKFVTAIDLFRFSSRSVAGGSGVIDWAADDFGKYFSVDGGATAIAAFSTGSVYEASHWQEGLGLMDPTAGAGEMLGFSSNDLRAFDVMGYDPVGVPEPGTGAVVAGGAMLLWFGRGRNRVFGGKN